MLSLLPPRLLYFVVVRVLFSKVFSERERTRERYCSTCLHSSSLVLLNATFPAAPATPPPVFLCWYCTVPLLGLCSVAGQLFWTVTQLTPLLFCYIFFNIFNFFSRGALLKTIQSLSRCHILSFFAIGRLNL